jgi:hypothetical protein
LASETIVMVWLLILALATLVTFGIVGAVQIFLELMLD